MKTKKWAVIPLILLLVFTLCACSVRDIAAYSIETLNGWSFQYNSGTDDFSLFFGLSDKNGKARSADAAVEIRIVNNADEEVYRGTKNITPDDFGYYSSPARGEQYLADVRIPASEIKKGKSMDGTVYFTVYSDVFSFDECKCPALYSLPVDEIKVIAEGLPAEFEIPDYFGSVQSTIRIDSIKCKTEMTAYTVVTVEITGEKTWGRSDSLTSLYDQLPYKLLDSEGYLVDSGTVMLDGLQEGDKFKDKSLMLYDLTPGETYTLSFSS